MYATGRAGQRRMLHIINRCRRSGCDGSVTGGSDTARGSNENSAAARRLNQRAIYSAGVAACRVDGARTHRTGLRTHSLLAQIMRSPSHSRAHHTHANKYDTALVSPSCLLDPERKKLDRRQ